MCYLLGFLFFVYIICIIYMLVLRIIFILLGVVYSIHAFFITNLSNIESKYKQILTFYYFSQLRWILQHKMISQQQAKNQTTSKQLQNAINKTIQQVPNSIIQLLGQMNDTEDKLNKTDQFIEQIQLQITELPLNFTYEQQFHSFIYPYQIYKIKDLSHGLLQREIQKTRKIYQQDMKMHTGDREQKNGELQSNTTQKSDNANSNSNKGHNGSPMFLFKKLQYFTNDSSQKLLQLLPTNMLIIPSQPNQYLNFHTISPTDFIIQSIFQPNQNQNQNPPSPPSSHSTQTSTLWLHSVNVNNYLYFLINNQTEMTRSYDRLLVRDGKTLEIGNGSWDVVFNGSAFRIVKWQKQSIQEYILEGKKNQIERENLDKDKERNGKWRQRRNYKPFKVDKIIIPKKFQVIRKLIQNNQSSNAPQLKQTPQVEHQIQKFQLSQIGINQNYENKQYNLKIYSQQPRSLSPSSAHSQSHISFTSSDKYGNFFLKLTHKSSPSPSSTTKILKSTLNSIQLIQQISSPNFYSLYNSYQRYYLPVHSEQEILEPEIVKYSVHGGRNLGYLVYLSDCQNVTMGCMTITNIQDTNPYQYLNYQNRQYNITPQQPNYKQSRQKSPKTCMHRLKLNPTKMVRIYKIGGQFTSICYYTPTNVTNHTKIDNDSYINNNNNNNSSSSSSSSSSSGVDANMDMGMGAGVSMDMDMNENYGVKAQCDVVDARCGVVYQFGIDFDDFGRNVQWDLQWKYYEHWAYQYNRAIQLILASNDSSTSYKYIKIYIKSQTQTAQIITNQSQLSQTASRQQNQTQSQQQKQQQQTQTNRSQIQTPTISYCITQQTNTYHYNANNNSYNYRYNCNRSNINMDMNTYTNISKINQYISSNDSNINMTVNMNMNVNVNVNMTASSLYYGNDAVYAGDGDANFSYSQTNKTSIPQQQHQRSLWAKQAQRDVNFDYQWLKEMSLFTFFQYEDYTNRNKFREKVAYKLMDMKFKYIFYSLQHQVESTQQQYKNCELTYQDPQNPQNTQITGIRLKSQSSWWKVCRISVDSRHQNLLLSPPQSPTPNPPISIFICSYQNNSLSPKCSYSQSPLSHPRLLKQSYKHILFIINSDPSSHQFSRESANIIKISDLNTLQMDNIAQSFFIMFIALMIVFLAFIVIVTCRPFCTLCWILLGRGDGANFGFRYPLNCLEIRVKMRGMVRNGIIRKEVQGYERGHGAEIDDCVFCLQEKMQGEHIIRTYCKHAYHRECFEEWVRQENSLLSCPMCKRKLNLQGLNRYNIEMMRQNNNIMGQSQIEQIL